MDRARVHPALALTLAAALALAAAAPPPPAPRARRQLPDDSLQPVDDAAQGVAGAAGREKRKLEGVAQASFGIKNAVLGLVFGKINSAIDAKTRLVETLDRTNIEKNRALGIEPPPSGISSFGSIFGQLIGPALQIIGPKVQAASGLLGGLSGGVAGASGGGAGGAGGGGLGSVLSLVSSLSGSSSGGGAGATVETIDSEEDDDDSS